jgi:cation diffusion facilitator family transporter
MAHPPVDRFFAFRHDLASRAAALSFTSNVTLMVMKLAVGVMTGSIAVLSDGIDSAQDAIASTFAFLSIRLGARPADEEHPYGHGKAESIAAAGQALLIAGGAAYIIAQAIHRMTGHHSIETTPGLIALAVTAGVNVCVVLYVGRAAKITGSMALRADTRHLWTNVAQAAAVFTALALVAITDNSIFDPIMALALAVYLLWTAVNVFMEALTEIMDVRLPKHEEQLIEECLQRNPSVRSHHGLRTRKAGRERYVDIHVTVDAQQTVEAAHTICDELSSAIGACLPGAVVTIHLEPDDGQSHAVDVEMSGD